MKAASTGVLALLILTFAITSFAKIRSFEGSAAFDPANDEMLFWTESAFHYRYAKMIAEGKSIPAVDYRAQMPEGLPVMEQITVCMEWCAGKLYRVLAGLGLTVPFHRFLIWFICIFSSLSIPAVYLAARALWGSVVLSCGAMLAYALVPLSFARVIGHYGREDFALPLLFLGFAFFLRALRMERARSIAVAAGVAGLFGAVALAGWHLSRFWFLMLSPFLFILMAFTPRREALFRALLVVTGLFALASWIVPVLVEKRFFFSGPMLASYAMLGALWFERRGAGRMRPLATAGVAFAGAAGLFAIVNLLGGYPEYSHVYGLIRYKLQFLGQKPADPALLPFDARILWSPPFNTPSIPFLIAQVGPFLLWGIGAWIAGAILVLKRRATPEQIGVFVLYTMFVALFVLIQRVSSFVAFFLVLAIPFLFVSASRGMKKALFFAFALSLIWQGAQDLLGPRAPIYSVARLFATEPAYVDPPNVGNNRRLLEWIRMSTERDDVFLTWYPTGPMILTYGQRPIVLHSKFESSVIRDKYRGLLEGLYEEEGVDGKGRVFPETLAQFCIDTQTDYFVHQISYTLDLSSDSELYRIGKRELPVASAAAAMHWREEALLPVLGHRFTLVYQDSYYRVFRFEAGAEDGITDAERAALADSAGGAEPSSRAVPYEAVWESVTIPGGARVVDAREIRDSRAYLDRQISLIRAAEGAFMAGDHGGAMQALSELDRMCPDSEASAILRARVRRSRGETERALAILDEAIALRPWLSSLRFEKAETLLSLGKPVRAARAYAEVIDRSPGHSAARARLAELGEKR
ncbi:MAG: hypothetical protein HKN20_14195 [Gemmatimonadetes bacterium]|nr:hypothetical protein [Gemmatimonadota bacterium]